MRLDRFLANSGVGTRREVKDLLKKRKIKLNGDIVTDGSIHVNRDKDEVEYNGKKVNYKPFVYIMMNKPAGVITATEDRTHKTVLDLLENEYRTYSLFPVGRLDKDTEGLLILTNDGITAHNLLSPAKHTEKKYYVELKRELSTAEIEKLESGIELENGTITKKSKIKIIENNEVLTRVYITITEGKYHQIKRMFKAVNNKVEYLKRIKMGNLELDVDLKKGKYRELLEEEIENLKNKC